MSSRGAHHFPRFPVRTTLSRGHVDTRTFSFLSEPHIYCRPNTIVPGTSSLLLIASLCLRIFLYAFNFLLFIFCFAALPSLFFFLSKQFCLAFLSISVLRPSRRSLRACYNSWQNLRTIFCGSFLFSSLLSCLNSFSPILGFLFFI